MAKLLQELNTPKDNFNTAFVRPHLKTITRKQIRSTAKKHGLYKNLKGLEPKDRQAAFRAIKRFPRLDTFLAASNPTSQPDLVMTDAWHYFFITCTTATDTIEYRGDFHTLFGQPIKKIRNNRYEARW